ncbi:MAG: hypothetical protein WBQ14_09455 [Gaiellaceae bacterium]
MEGSATARGGPPRQTGPWYGRDRDRICFEWSARGFQGLRPVKSGGDLTYYLQLDVPHYEQRQVEIQFRHGSYMPHVFVDGLTSPHRFTDDDSLCVWCWKDPIEKCWVFRDGLLVLINHIQAHLFREAWWRETGEWLGPEVRHATPKEPVRE